LRYQLANSWKVISDDLTRQIDRDHPPGILRAAGPTRASLQEIRQQQALAAETGADIRRERGIAGTSVLEGLGQ
jgi:hypothetical protein